MWYVDTQSGPCAAYASIFPACARSRAQSPAQVLFEEMVGTSRLFIGGLPISKDLSKNELQKIVSMYAKDVEIITDSEGNLPLSSLLNYPRHYHMS